MHRIRRRKFEPNTTPQDVHREGNLQPDDEIIMPKEDLYVMGNGLWGFSDSGLNKPNTTANANIDDIRYTNAASDHTDPISTDLDLGSTGSSLTNDPDHHISFSRNSETDSIDQNTSVRAIVLFPRYQTTKMLMVIVS